MAMLDTKNDKKEVVRKSNKLLNDLLPELAPALYAGLSVSIWMAIRRGCG